jgi:hypothetical protein
MINYNNKVGISADKGIKDISMFRDDKFCLFVYKKTIKLSAGVYVVTNLLSDEEPLKWELRRYGQKLLSSAVSAGNSSEFSRCEVDKILSTYCLTIISILEVAFYAGLISQMNYTILKDEFTAFAISLDEQIHKGPELHETLDQRFFELPKEYRAPENNIVQERQARKGSNSRGVYKGHTIGQNKGVSFSNLNIGQKLISKYGQDDKGQQSVVVQKNDQKSIRKDSIISILKNSSDPLTIKDISINIKDCGEKTIQRELLSMVGSGVLKKEGERRWSRYSLMVK